jgi:hypothetical protein
MGLLLIVTGKYDVKRATILAWLGMGEFPG